MKRIAIVIAAVLLLATLLPAAALAHEGREVGEYHLVVGFRVEPALIDEPNSVYLLVTKDAQLGEAHQDDEAAGHSHEGESEPEPIEGLADTLTVKVSYGSASKEFSLSPVFGEPGAYVAHFIPTAAGTYVFQFRGTIEGMTINETFESGPGRFNDVEEKKKLAFPEPRLSPAELQVQLEEASQSTNQATVFGLIGIVLGAIGALSGLGAMFLRRS